MSPLLMKLAKIAAVLIFFCFAECAAGEFNAYTILIFFFYFLLSVQTLKKYFFLYSKLRICLIINNIMQTVIYLLCFSVTGSNV